MGKPVYKRRFWTEVENRFLRIYYPNGDTVRIAAALGRTERSVWQRARILGILKSDVFLTNLGKRLAESGKGKATRFPKGNVPFNKGKKEWQFRSRESMEKCAMTQFKAGQVPHNAHPEGYECMRSDGYLYIKTSERRMELKHVWVWQQHNGPVPDGYVIAFIDGDHSNCDISNLRLMKRAELIQLTNSRRSPERWTEIHAKAQAKRNKSIHMDYIRIHWGLEAKTKLVKRWHEPERNTLKKEEYDRSADS